MNSSRKSVNPTNEPTSNNEDLSQDIGGAMPSMAYKSPHKDHSASGSSCGDGSVAMSMREQDNQLQILRKENFHLKLKIYFLEQMQTNQGGAEIDRDALELKITVEVLRSELQEKQKLICEAANGMEQMEQLHKQQIDECQEKTNQLNLRINQLESQIEDIIYEREQEQPLNLSMSAQSDSQRISELEIELAKCEAELQMHLMHRRSSNEELASKSDHIRELQLNNNRVQYRLEELQELLTQKDEIILQLEQFRNCAKTSYATQLDRLSKENADLISTIASLKTMLQRSGAGESSYDDNFRIISKQSRLMQELHSKKNSMDNLRSELIAAERELKMMRSHNDMLFNQLEPSRYDSESSSSKSLSVLNAICGHTELLENCTSSTSTFDEAKPPKASLSDPTVIREVWKLENENIFTSSNSLSSSPSSSQLLNSTTKSMHPPLQFLTNPMFCRFNESTHQQMTSCSKHCHRIGATIQLPVSPSGHGDEMPKPKHKTSVTVRPDESTNEIDSPKKSIVGHGLKYLFDRMKN